MNKFLLIILSVALFLAYIPFGFALILLRGAMGLLDIIISAFDEALSIVGELLEGKNDL